MTAVTNDEFPIIDFKFQTRGSPLGSECEMRLLKNPEIRSESVTDGVEIRGGYAEEYIKIFLPWNKRGSCRLCSTAISFFRAVIPKKLFFAMYEGDAKGGFPVPSWGPCSAPPDRATSHVPGSWAGSAIKTPHGLTYIRRGEVGQRQRNDLDCLAFRDGFLVFDALRRGRRTGNGCIGTTTT